MLLFQFSIFCKADKPTVTAKENGTEIVVTKFVAKCRKELGWNSQPETPGVYMAAGNFLFCLAVLFAGSSIAKVRQVFKHMGLTCVSTNTYYIHQKVQCVHNSYRYTVSSVQTVLFRFHYPEI